MTEMTTMQSEGVSCPKCGGAMWDNRMSKRNPKQPDFKCKQRSCDGVVWPARNQAQQNGHRAPQQNNARQGYDVPPAGTMPYDGPVSNAPQPIEQAPETEGTTRFKTLANVHRACFKAALRLSADAETAGVSLGDDALSALTAQLFIAFNEGH